MSNDENNIAELSKKFMEKNLSFIRVAMENHRVETEILEICEGKITKWRYKAHAKEEK